MFFDDRWRLHKQSGGKFCTQCKDFCPSAGGMQIVSEDKLHQRWICQRCKDRQDETLQKAAHT